MAEPTEPIRPRTKSERLAYLAGFATAVELVATEGLSVAQRELQEMAEGEECIGG